MSNVILPDDPNYKQPLIMGDAYSQTPKGKIKQAVASHSSGEQSGTFKYASTLTAHSPESWVKTSQIMGANTTLTNPNFFSPLHTPQSWQIASKRREVYMWSRFWYSNEPKVAAAIDFYCFTPDTQILMADGRQKSISSVEVGDMVRSHDGTANKVVRKFKREANEDILHVYVKGINAPIKTSKTHKIKVYHNSSIQYREARDLLAGDMLVCPSINRSLYKQTEFDGVVYDLKEVKGVESKPYSGQLHDMEVENAHTYIANEIACSNSRFPMNGFELECESEKVNSFFKHHVIDKLKLNEVFKQVSSEYFMLGDVFVHTNISCPVCHGSAIDPETGERCNHPKGMINRIVILNPDWIEVQQTSLSKDPAIVMIPDEDLKNIVRYKSPPQIYEQIPDRIKELVIAGKPIPLSNNTTSHLKHMPVPYDTYGNSLIRRLFMTLAYKTKLMSANWIVAERLMLPVRVVKIGSDTRPASSADIADVQQQLAASANDPNLTIVTHHNFSYDWYGSSGKIVQVTQELEWTGKEILDGFMLNQSLLNGEMSSYMSAQVGVETLIRRIESWRQSLAEWCEENVFKPIAEMQGFVDEEKSAEVGETVYVYPKIKWNDLQLKDKTQWHQILMQLHDKQIISTQTLMEELHLNYDQEVKRLRYEQMSIGAVAQQQGGAGGMGGGMDAGGGMGGGAGGMDPSGGMGGAGGVAGMGLGGGMGGGMDAGGGMGGGGAPGGGMGASAGGVQKVVKKGKADAKQEQEQTGQIGFVKLTSIEQKLMQKLEEIAPLHNLSMNRIRAQFPVENPQGGPPLKIDFAIPDYKLGIEGDGEIWHSSPKQKMSDQERDYLLAQRGWTILRFTDKTIEDAPRAVKETIQSFMAKARDKYKHKKADGDGIHIFKYANGEIVDMGSDYSGYSSEKTIHTTGVIGGKSEYKNIQYESKYNSTELFE